MKSRQGREKVNPSGNRKAPDGGLPNLSGSVDDGTKGDRIVGRSDVRQDKPGVDRKGDRGRIGGGPDTGEDSG